MNTAVQAITWQGLVLALVPTFIVLGIMWRWTAGIGTGIYATLRMLVQLLLIGYVLVFIFETGQPTIVLGILGAMLMIASWISIRPLAHKSRCTDINISQRCADVGTREPGRDRYRSVVQPSLPHPPGRHDLRRRDEHDQPGG
jgi:hypothetical protein